MEGHLNYRRVSMNAKLVASTIIAGLAIVLIIQNVAGVEFRFFFWTLSMSMAMAIFLTFMFGVITGWLLRGTFKRRKYQTRNKLGAVIE